MRVDTIVNSQTGNIILLENPGSDAAGLALAAALATAAGLDAGADGAGELAAGAAPPPHAASTSRGRLASPFSSEFMRCMVAQLASGPPSEWSPTRAPWLRTA